MNTRHEITLASESIATAATKTIEIDLSEVVSRFNIRVKGTNSSSTPTAHPATIISKIELIDGSDVLFSLSGQEAQALNFYETGKMPFNIEEYENNIEACATMHLNFGRFLWDTQYALKPKIFRNLQLKITHNKASGGSAPDGGTLYVSADVFDQKAVNPVGFLQSKLIEAKTLTASGHSYVDLPRDQIIRRLILKSLSASNPPSGQISKVKIKEDGGRRLPFNDVSMSEYIKSNLGQMVVNERLAGLGTASAVTYYIVPTYESYGVGVGRSAAGAGIIVAQPSGNAMNITNDTSESFAVIVQGYCPHGAIDFPFGNPMDPADWFDPKGLKDLEVDITAASGASGTAEVITQELRRNGPV